MNIFSILNLRSEFDDIMFKNKKSFKSDIDSLTAFVKQCTRKTRACDIAKAIIGEANGNRRKAEFVRRNPEGAVCRLRS